MIHQVATQCECGDVLLQRLPQSPRWSRREQADALMKHFREALLIRNFKPAIVESLAC